MILDRLTAALEVVGGHWTIHNTQSGDTTRGSTVSVPFTLYCPHIEHCRTVAASQTFVRKQHYNIPTLLLYLLYMRMSGVQMVLGGNLRSFTFPYSVSFHRRLLSVHS